MLKLKDLNTVLEPCENRLVYIYKRHIGGPPQFFCQIHTAFYNDIDIRALADIISKSEPDKTPNEILESRIFMCEEWTISGEIHGLNIIVHLDSKGFMNEIGRAHV